MSEFLSDEDGNNPGRELAEIVGASFIQRRAFYGQKVARDIINEWGAEFGDEAGALLESLVGTCVTNGIVLGQTRSTSPDSVQARIQYLTEQLQQMYPKIAGSLGPHIPDFVSRGVDFFETDLAQNSPKVQEWAGEFDLLYSIGTQE